MISGLKDTFDPRHHQRLESKFDEYNVKHVHYMFVDVEGGE